MLAEEYYHNGLSPTFDAICQLYTLLEARRELKLERKSLVAHRIDNFLRLGKSPTWVWSNFVEEIHSDDFSILFSRILPLNPNINVQSQQKGIVALHRVAQSANVQHLEALIHLKADINVQDRDGWTPLASYLTKTPCRCECGKLLLRYGAHLPPMEILPTIAIRYVKLCLKDIVQERNTAYVAITLLRIVPARAENCIVNFLYPTHEDLSRKIAIIHALSY